jgi:RNA polymerase sigma factor (sigma-70 family)
VSTFGLGDETATIAAATAGDPEAIGALIQRYQGTIYRFLLSRTGDGDRAADLTQDTFLKALRGLGSYRGEASFRVWLLGIARNEFLGALRKEERRREEALDPAVVHAWAEDPDPLPDARIESADSIDRVRAMMARLPEKQRTSVWLRLHEGMSFREIGEATGSSEGAARVNYFHGIRKLREWLDHE